MSEGKNCPQCGKPMVRGRLYSYQGMLPIDKVPIYWVEDGKTSWNARELVNVSEDAKAYLCRNCWITVLYELGDRTETPNGIETGFDKAFKEQKRGK